jgi:subtilase family serine protease
VPPDAPGGVRTIVHLPPRDPGGLDALIAQQSDRRSPLYRHWLTPAQFRASYGPSSADLRSAASALERYGFRTSLTSQGVVADAAQAVFERTFGVRLLQHSETVSGETRSVLAADRAPALPAELARLHAQVADLASTHSPRPQVIVANREPLPDNRYSQTGGYWFDDLKEAYQYPAYGLARGTGRTIAVVGAGDYLDSDMSAYFGHEHLAVPQIARRPVYGGPPAFDAGSAFSQEATLDVQQAAGSAPGARILFYGAPNASDASFIGMFAAIADDNLADVVSSSYGQCELYYTAAYNHGTDFTGILQIYDDLFRQLNSQGTTVVDGSGDAGAYDCVDPSGSRATAGVEAWAADPSVTAVGGTNLITSVVKSGSPLRSTYERESAYFDRLAPGPGVPSGAIFGSGGGKSVLFRKPPFQFAVNTHASTRAVPDVAMHMGGCPANALRPCGPGRSYDIAIIGGKAYGIIGTSAAAPDFAGLQAIQDTVLGMRAGNVNYLLYDLAAEGSLGNGPIFRNDIPGNNGYATTPGYNFVLGNGTVRGAQYALLPYGPFAGDPQTATNP